MFSEGLYGQNYYYAVLRPYMAFSLSLSRGIQGSFSRGYMTCDDMVALKANGICASVFLCFKFLSILILNTANVDRYNTHKTRAHWGT